MESELPVELVAFRSAEGRDAVTLGAVLEGLSDDYVGATLCELLIWVREVALLDELVAGRH